MVDEPSMSKRTLGVIGGSGLYQLEGLENVEEVRVETPFGAPSDAILRGELEGTVLLFLPRHGRGHTLAPHRVNYRANVLALKLAGAEQLVSVSAVGSMKESINPSTARATASTPSSTTGSWPTSGSRIPWTPLSPPRSTRPPARSARRP